MAMVPTPLTRSELRDRLTLTPVEASRVLGLSERSVYDALRSGRLPGVKVGTRWLVSASGIESLIGDEPADHPA
jgi:excisionase family DNA binding protein